jgi:hypothetical protein
MVVLNSVQDVLMAWYLVKHKDNFTITSLILLHGVEIYVTHDIQYMERLLHSSLVQLILQFETVHIIFFQVV